MADATHLPPIPEQPIGFCQQCGKPLQPETVRRVGAAVYCEPCLADRLAGGAVPPPASVYGSQPNPGLAAWLGLIPGVGAMYNEQYAKGIVHLIVFALLVSFADHNGIFGLFVAGWIFYMAIEAHHTARARRDGTPLPNPFGLNDIGERLGFGRSWPSGPGVGGVAQSASEAFSAAAATAAAGFRSAPPPTPPRSSPPYEPVTEPAWGAPVEQPVSPPAYGTPPYTQAAYQPVNYAGPAAYATQPPYASAPAYATQPPYASAPSAGAGGMPAEMPILNTSVRNRFPVGAAWLIALGTLFLLATSNLFNGLPGETLLGFVLLGLGGWIFTHSFFNRPSFVPDALNNSGEGQATRALFALRSSLMLLVAGSLCLLDGFHLIRWSRSWPLLLIGAGVLMLLNRAGWQMRASLIARSQTEAADPFAGVPAEPYTAEPVTRDRAGFGSEAPDGGAANSYGPPANSDHLPPGDR